MKLSPRLKCVASFVKKDARVVDVGTDHGYIPVYLVENNISKKIIATDINKGPLNKAKRLIQLRQYEDYIETRLGNGLEVLNPKEVDTAIIAGMGGLLITEIIAGAENVVKNIDTFILQPMVASDLVRKFLYSNNFKIIDEKLAKEEEKIYEIIVAQHGKDKLEKEIHLEIGKCLINNRDKLLNDFIRKKICEIDKILYKMEGKNSKKAELKRQDLLIRKYRLKEVLKSL